MCRPTTRRKRAPPCWSLRTQSNWRTASTRRRSGRSWATCTSWTSSGNSRSTRAACRSRTRWSWCSGRPEPRKSSCPRTLRTGRASTRTAARKPGAGEPMADFAALFIADLVLGLLLGCVLAVIAHGLNIIWGVAKVVNIAHGEFIMLGAYGAYFLYLYAGFNPLLSVPIDAAIGLAVGVGFYFGFLHRELRGKESMGLQSELVTLVSTFGLSLVIVNVAQSIWEHPVGILWSPGSAQIGPVPVPFGGLYVAVVSVALIALTDLFLTRTYLGNAIRAYTQDIPATQLMGINPTFVAAVGIGMGFSVTMAGGALLTGWLPTGIDPTKIGILYAPISFVIVVLGGPGKMWGSLVGGLTIGLIINVGQLFLGGSIALATAVAVLTLIPILLFRPEGILR